MKKILSLFLSVILLCFLTSCQHSILLMTDTQVYDYQTASDEYTHHTNYYSFQTSPTFSEKTYPKKRSETIADQSVSLDYYFTKTDIGQSYETDIYFGNLNEKLFCQINYHEKSGKITLIELFDKAITYSETKLNTEAEFLEFSRTIASKFMNTEGAITEIHYKSAPPPNVYQASYHGDEYVFIKTLAGYPTMEKVTVSILPNGGVQKIEYEAVDQFEDFKALDDDPDFKTVMEEALEKARIKTLLQGKGTYESEKIEYYLINDAGTLLLHYTQTGTYTPNVEEYQQAPYYDQPYTYQKSVIIPVAELS